MKTEKAIAIQSRKRNLKYGSISLAFILSVLLIIVFINILVNRFDIKMDFTENKVFSLSEETKEMLKAVEEKVTITILEKAGSEISTTSRVVEQFAYVSDNIEVQWLDPELHPQLLQKYGNQQLTFGSVIVESGNKVRIFHPIELITLSQDHSRITEIVAESKIANAILSVTSKGERVLYISVGHDEDPLSNEIKEALENENIKVEEKNLLIEDLPASSDSLFLLNNIKRDLTEDEIQKLNDFLNNGGRMVVIDDLYEIDRPNYENLLFHHGIRIDRSVVFENKMANRINSDKFIIVPNFGDHPIVHPLSEANYKVIIAYGQPIEILEVKRDYLSITPLLLSSEESYSKEPDIIRKRESIEQEENDPLGPFHLAVAISREELGTEHPSIVLFSNSFFLNDSLIERSNRTNLDLLINSVNWLTDRESQLLIRPKDVTSSPVEINNFQQIIVGIITIFCIPFVVGMSGFSYWYRRQKT